jgi:uncharacterized protein YecT (DUF1311 family)
MNAPRLLLSLIIAAPAWAGDPCDKAITTIEINQCGQSRHQAADRNLNAAYQAALKRIQSRIEDPEQRKHTRQGLVEAQRLWVQFRDKDCGAVYSFWQAGTIRGAMYWGCMTARTQQRLEELESFSMEPAAD